MTEGISDKSRGVALALCVPLGWLGVHRFYAGKIGTGMLQLCTFGGLGVWWMVDTILVAAGAFRDIDGDRLWEWAEPNPNTVRPAQMREQMEAIMDAMYAVKEDMNDLSNRVDFMERVLEQAREDRQIGPPETQR